MTTKDEKEILAVVEDFLRSYSNKKPPFSDTLRYLVPDGLAVLSRPDGVVHCTLADLVHRLEQTTSDLLESGAETISEVLVHPGPDIWVHDKTAAVWSGFRVDVDGQKKSEGIRAFALLKIQDEWKIVLMADTHLAGDEALPCVVHEATSGAPELVAPLIESNRLLNEKRWDEMMEPRFSGGGATIARSSNTPKTMLWPELDEKMKSMSERAPGYVEHKLVNWEGRIMGNMGLVWSKSTVTLDGELKITDYAVATLLNEDNKWLVTGLVA